MIKKYRFTIIAIISFIAFYQNNAFSQDSKILNYDKVIAIDIGHSINKFGALSSAGVKEYDFNKNIGSMLFKELMANGYKNTIIVNESGNDISLKERSEQINKTKAEILISIHHDSVQPHYLKTKFVNGKKIIYTNDHTGFSIFFSKSNSHNVSSLKLAKLIGQSLTKNSFVPTYHHAEKIDGENRDLVDKENGIYNVDFAILRSSKMPSILIECGIIVNPDEEIMLMNKIHQVKIVKSISEAINKYFSKNL